MNQDNANRRKFVPWIFLPCIMAFIMQFIASIIVIEGGFVYAMGTFHGKTWDEVMSYIYDILLSDTLSNIIMVVYSVVGIILFLSIYNSKFMEGKTYSLEGVSKNKPATFGGIVLFCVGMQYVSIYLISALGRAFPAWIEEYNELIEESGLGNTMPAMLAFYALIAGPIVEELIFRGLTLAAAKKVMPYYMAILVQAILFGAYHMNAIQGCYAFVLGLGLGYVMHLYDNLFFTILIHIAYNFIGTIGSAILPVGGDTIISFFFWLLFALIVSYAGLVLLRKGAASVKEDDIIADI